MLEIKIGKHPPHFWIKNGNGVIYCSICATERGIEEIKEEREWEEHIENLKKEKLL